MEAAKLFEEKVKVSTLLGQCKSLEIKLKICRNINQDFCKSINLISTCTKTIGTVQPSTTDYYTYTSDTNTDTDAEAPRTLNQDDGDGWRDMICEKALLEKRRSFVRLHQKSLELIDKGLALKQNYLASAGNGAPVSATRDENTIYFDASGSDPKCNSSNHKTTRAIKKRVFANVKMALLAENARLANEKASSLQQQSDSSKTLSTAFLKGKEMNEKLEILIQAHGQLDLSISSLSRDLTKLDQRKAVMKKAHEILLRNRKTISTLNGKFPSSLEAFDALHYLYLQNQTQTLGKFEWDWNYGKVMRDLVCLFTDELYQDSGIHCGDMSFQEFATLARILKQQSSLSLSAITKSKQDLGELQNRHYRKRNHQHQLDSLLDAHQLFLSGSYQKMLDSLLSDKFSMLESSLRDLENVLVPDIEFASNQQTKSMIDETINGCVDVFTNSL